MQTPNDQEFTIVLADNGKSKAICTSKGFRYTPDSSRHIYGKSQRRPLEAWFLDELRFFQTTYPGFDIFTLGSSCVFGEKFITYLTICEFSIDSEAAFQSLVNALHDSDMAIRKKLNPHWKWDFAGRRNFDIVFMVGFMDFAYFLQHRNDFRGEAHNRYMASFTGSQTAITSTDFKVLQDGTIAKFDESKLSVEDRQVYDNYKSIAFSVEPV